MKKFYVAVAVGCTVEAAKSSDMVRVQFKVLEGPEAGSYKYWNGSISDKAFEYTAKALRTCGWTGDDFYELTDGPKNGLGDNKVQLVENDNNWITDEGEHKTNRRIDFINSLNGPEIKARQPAKGVGDRARFKAALRAIPAVVVPQENRAPSKEVLDALKPSDQQPDAPVATDDLPF